jgi:hypothetical protein
MKTLLLLLSMIQTPGTLEGYAFEVRHDHAFGACRGQLIIGNESLRYDTEDARHAREWTYPDVRSFEIVSPDEIRIHTYESAGVLKLGRDRTFTFRVQDAELDKEVYRFLQAHSPRPVRTRVVFDLGASGTTESFATAGPLLQELPARHDHLWGGCQGTLTITEEQITYTTQNPRDSRIWRLADVESFASTGDFDLRISTEKETFHFDLKVPLNSETYTHIWERVYEPQIQSYRGRIP